MTYEKNAVTEMVKDILTSQISLEVRTPKKAADGTFAAIQSILANKKEWERDNKLSEGNWNNMIETFKDPNFEDRVLESLSAGTYERNEDLIGEIY